MCKLRNLCVVAEKGCIECMFYWKTLVSLERIKLYGDLYLVPQFGCTDLFILRNLKAVIIFLCDPQQHVIDQMIMLGCKLALQRPNVCFRPHLVFRNT